MFRLYKQRDFSELINDTLDFYRVFGKNYFKNYILINGGPLLALLLLMYLLGDVFYETMTASLYGPDSVIEDGAVDNTGLFMLGGTFVAILVFLLSVLTYCFPVVYLKMVERNVVPTASQMFKAMLGKVGKIILFVLLSIITFFPIAIIMGALSMLLFVIIIGIPFAFIIFTAFLSWMFLTFYDYINNDSGYFEAMRNGFNILFQNFWANVGSTVIFLIIIIVLQGALSFIPYLFGIADIFSTNPVEEMAKPELLSVAGMLMLLMFVLSTVVGYLLSNMLITSQGIIYYSAREANENLSLQSDIDLIGRDGE